jgi:hypothetical protein
MELLVGPVEVETLHHLGDFDSVRGHDSVVARFSQVTGFPVERLHKPRRIVDHHRFLVSDGKCRAAVADADASGDEFLSRFLVLGLSASARGVQHDPHVHAPAFGGDNRVEKRRIGEQEHPDVHRPLCAGERVENRFGGVIGQDDQSVRHDLSPGFQLAFARA